METDDVERLDTALLEHPLAPDDRSRSPGPTSNVVVISPSHGWKMLQLAEIWKYRELLYFLVWRDVKVRYKQTALGVLWVIVQPIATMVVFTLVLGRLAGLDKGTPNGLPYPVVVFAGLVPWTLFSATLAVTSQSLVANTTLVTKVYFPRLILPISSAGSYLIDYVLSTLVLLVLMAHYGLYPGWQIVVLPVLVLLTLIAAIGVGTWLTALNVRYRDVRYIVPFLTQIWLFASPVVYSTTRIPAKYRFIYDLNPVAGVIEGFRWALLGTPWQLGYLPAVSVAVSVLILTTGAFFFRRVERTFADEI